MSDNKFTEFFKDLVLTINSKITKGSLKTINGHNLEGTGDINLDGGNINGINISHIELQFNLTGSQTVNSFLPVFQGILSSDTTLENPVLNNYTIKLLPGKLYKFSAQLYQVTKASGGVDIIVALYSDAAGTTKIRELGRLYLNSYTTALRNFSTDIIIIPTTVSYIKMYPSTWSNGATSDVVTVHSKIEINSNISGKLSGLSELPAYILDTEVKTAERWIDGRPIWQKVISVAPLPNTVEKIVPLNLSTTAQNVWLDPQSFCVNPSSGRVSRIAAAYNPSNIVNADVVGTNLVINCNNNYTGYTIAYAIIKFTKASESSSTPAALVGGFKNFPTGLFELPSPKLNIEVLTTKRHPINKKRLYSRTINYGALPNATTKAVVHGITGIDTISVDHTNSSIYLSNGKQYSLAWASAAFASQWNVAVDLTNIEVWTGTNRTTMLMYITLEYTKTTDTVDALPALIGNNYEISYGETKLPMKRHGKQVYCREVTFGILPNATVKNVDIGFTSNEKENIEDIWLDEQNSYAKSSTNRIPLNYSTSGTSNYIHTTISNTFQIISDTGMNLSEYISHPVILYTKIIED